MAIPPTSVSVPGPCIIQGNPTGKTYLGENGTKVVDVILHIPISPPAPLVAGAGVSPKGASAG